MTKPASPNGGPVRNPGPAAAQPVGNGVIVADNDAMLRGILRSVLTQAGQQVFLAGDGQEAVTLARQFQASLVVLDVYMPRMDGLAACRAIRQLPGYQTRPIILLTADDRPSMQVKANHSNATRVLTKPIQIDALLDVLGSYISIPPAARGAGDPSATRSWAPPGEASGGVGGSVGGTVAPASPNWVLRIARDAAGSKLR